MTSQPPEPGRPADLPASSDAAPAADPAAPEHLLEQVIDDEVPREMALKWATAELLRGRTVEDVTHELIALNWSPDDAEGIAETARRQTRAERGVVTRDDIAQLSEANYRQTTRRLPYFAFGGIVGVFIAIGNLLKSLAMLRRQQSPTSSAPVDPERANDR